MVIVFWFHSFQEYELWGEKKNLQRHIFYVSEIFLARRNQGIVGEWNR